MFARHMLVATVGTEAQYRWAAREFPTLDARDALQVALWVYRNRPDERLEAEALVEAEAGPWVATHAVRGAKVRQATAAEIAVSGYQDVRYDEWVGSETYGIGAEHDDEMAVWREAQDEADAAYVAREWDDAAVTRRWNRPDDELEFSEMLRELGLEEFWAECMTEFRRVKLHRTLQRFFGLDEYQERSLVLKWEQGRNGKYRPVEQANVVEWIERSVAFAGSRLGGYQSCTQSLIEKAKRKGKRVAVRIERREFEPILANALEVQGVEVAGLNGDSFADAEEAYWEAAMA